MRRYVWGALAATVLVTGTARAEGLPFRAGFDHVAIKVDDQQRSIDFYNRVFGFREGAVPFAPPAPRWMDMGKGMSLHIQFGRNDIVPPPRSVHFAIAVSDMAAFVAHLKALDIPYFGFQGQKQTVDDLRSDKVKQTYIQDPDGYWIEVNDKPH